VGKHRSVRVPLRRGARALLTERSTSQVKAQIALARPGLPSLALRRTLVVGAG
jgi:hypothetical protein